MGKETYAEVSSAMVVPPSRAINQSGGIDGANQLSEPELRIHSVSELAPAFVIDDL